MLRERAREQKSLPRSGAVGVKNDLRLCRKILRVIDACVTPRLERTPVMLTEWRHVKRVAGIERPTDVNSCAATVRSALRLAISFRGLKSRGTHVYSTDA